MKLVCCYKNHEWRVATPTLDLNIAQGSVSALAFLEADDPSDLGRTFSRRVDKFEINTFVYQDDDTGSVSFEMVKKRKNVLLISASRGKDGKRAAYGIALHSKRGR